MKRLLELHEEKYREDTPKKTLCLTIFVVLLMTLFAIGGVSYLLNMSRTSDVKIDLTVGSEFFVDGCEGYEHVFSNFSIKGCNYTSFQENVPYNEEYLVKVYVSALVEAVYPQKPVVYIDRPYFNEIEVYYQSLNGEINMFHPEQSVFLYPFFGLPDDLDPNFPILIKAKHIIPSYRIMGEEERTFHRNMNALTYIILLLFGIIYGMIILNLCLGLFLRDTCFLIHSAYLFSVLMYDLYSNRVIGMLSNTFHVKYYAWAFISFAAVLILVYYYLDIRTYMKSIGKVYFLLIVVNIVLVLTTLMGFGMNLFYSGVIMGLAVSSLIISCLLYYLFKKIYVSKYFIIGSLVLGFSIVVYILQEIRVVPSSALAQHGWTYALSLEAVFFTLGILERLKNLRLEGQMYYEIAVTDKLTKINNRHYYDINIDRVMEFCRRFDFPLMVLMFDIDHFKKVNDTFGHDVGDIVLKNVAQSVKKVTRIHDVYIRWGGEEFLVLMPNTNTFQAANYAEKIRRLVEESKPYKNLSITISLGVSKWTVDEDICNTIKRADQGLYRAKKQGRNQVVMLFTDEEILDNRISWSSLLDCGHETIDEEHKKLLELAQGIPLNSESDEFVEQLIKLSEVLSEHFRSEESVLKSIGYCGLEEHIKLHNHIEEVLKEVIGDYIENKMSSREIMVEMIQNFIIGHLITDDLKFFRLFRDEVSNEI